MFISLEETQQIIIPQNTSRVGSDKDTNTTINKFKLRPQGIIVTDSYNNPFFPIRPMPRLDTSKLDTPEVYRRYRELHSEKDSLFLPWHFCVELYQTRYLVLNTRPLDMKFPLTTDEALKVVDPKVKQTWDDKLKSFMTNKLFDISDAIHICVIGDSNIDVYTKRTYEIIGRTCTVPTLRREKLPSGMYQRVFDFNMGERFNLKMISKFIRK